MNKYIIQFKPMGPYFFGMENRKVSQENINTDEANYFLKSSKFPQQSTILGAIRFFFLQNVCPENKSREPLDPGRFVPGQGDSLKA